MVNSLVCPANPQTCCQVVVTHKTDLVPPAQRNTVTVARSVEAQIEKVCAGKVFICGVIRRVVSYTSELGEATSFPDDVPFQCDIERLDANENDIFQVTGTTLLCEVFARETNLDTAHSLAFALEEKVAVLVCIRKVTAPVPLNSV